MHLIDANIFLIKLVRILAFSVCLLSRAMAKRGKLSVRAFRRWLVDGRVLIPLPNVFRALQLTPTPRQIG